MQATVSIKSAFKRMILITNLSDLTGQILVLKQKTVSVKVNYACSTTLFNRFGIVQVSMFGSMCIPTNLTAIAVLQFFNSLSVDFDDSSWLYRLSEYSLTPEIDFQICMYYMAVRVVEFSNGGTKLERFLPKNQHTQRIILKF